MTPSGFQLVDQFGIVQIFPVSFLVFAVLFSIGTFTEIRRVRKLNVPKMDKALVLFISLTIQWIILAWLGLLAFFPAFFRRHGWIAFAALFVWVGVVVIASKRNKEALARIKKASGSPRQLLSEHTSLRR